MSSDPEHIDRPLYVTSPLMPDYEEFTDAIRPLWESRHLTNNGTFLREFEKAVGEYLGEEYVTIYSNGTLPLLASFHAFDLKGEVITTPYTFIATAHALRWCGLRPVFVDVDPTTGNLDPSRIEDAITERTSAILPVHVYGRPCDTSGIAEVAKLHNLPVVYDAAHTFGVRNNGKSLTSEGDLATISFHATKVFNTIEGGAVISRDAATKHLLDRLRNFGFESETQITAVGINAKLDEMRAIFGLLNLRKVDDAIEHRKIIAASYHGLLCNSENITLPVFPETIRSNFSHYPVLFRDKTMRDAIYHALKSKEIYPRRYFYPLVTDFAPYSSAPGADNTPTARDMSNRVLCLPIHTAMSVKDAERVAEVILKILEN